LLVDAFILEDAGMEIPAVENGQTISYVVICDNIKLYASA